MASRKPTRTLLSKSTRRHTIPRAGVSNTKSIEASRVCFVYFSSEFSGGMFLVEFDIEVGSFLFSQNEQDAVVLFRIA